MSAVDPMSAQVGVAASGSGTLPASTPTQSRWEVGPEKDSPEARKLRKSAQEFEAILVSSWWQEMQNSFQDPETEQEAGFDTLQQLGFQSMAMAIAGSGGIGLARMVFHKLAPALGRDRPTDTVTNGLERSNE